MKKSKTYLVLLFALCIGGTKTFAQQQPRQELDFNKGWKFTLGDQAGWSAAELNDKTWRTLDLPHDWSIEGKFDKNHPATVGGGALPGGTGWYRKQFQVPASAKGKYIAIDFDGVYRNAEVWINGHYLGKRPNGYIAFRYDLSRHLRYGGMNTIAVKVDNAKQPNSRWYSGSGIYRDVKLLTTNPVHVEQWGSYVTTPEVTEQSAKVQVELSVAAAGKKQAAEIKTQILDASKKVVASTTPKVQLGGTGPFTTSLEVKNPNRWSVEHPYLYTVQSQVLVNGKEVDRYDTPLGIRSFSFDQHKGFSLNGKEMKIRGVCMHHDLGALGAAFNVRAAERQLEILKSMGVNGLRTSHNPPAKALLELCDKMGFIVMNEAFDMWVKKKSDYDYHLDWDKWHKKDLEDQILRDRNHPSVMMWSIGNEIPEQGGTGADTSGRVITRELAAIVRNLDKTRPITTGNNNVEANNNLVLSGALDVIGYNYNHDKWKDFHKTYPGQKLIASETTSALQTRGSYDMKSDSARIWPVRWDLPLLTGNDDFSCSAYDNCYTPWGSSHEQTLEAFENNPVVSGMFVWTGFDYLGEPTPYTWPARSSYFGIMDLAGFPKDVYHLYKSAWTNEPVLHIMPHWNWKDGQEIDVISYYSQADEVELYLNGVSQGKKSKQGQDMKVMWRLKYAPGELKAVSRKSGKTVLEKVIRTAGAAAKLELTADRSKIHADGKDLSFVTVRVLDKDGNLVPDAANLINFKIEGDAEIRAVDNGSPISHESFQANHRKAFNGLALAIIKAGSKASKVTLSASSEGLQAAQVQIEVN
ncbi:beta-galactosidase GalB [Pedobacter sp. SAFR-022]|uniref:beta-galactosidase GalB n=1 Tax=Pedobacter sp. SAFR-022 TaxID=3436861 RepID=UPI003F7CECC1